MTPYEEAASEVGKESNIYTFNGVLTLYSNTMELKRNCYYEVKVLTLSFNFKVFISTLDKLCKNYSPFYI